MSLVILVPMLGRPHRVAPLLASIRASCEARVLFLLTPGDHDVIAAVGAEEQLFVEREPAGDYARKINQGIAATDEDLIFTGADDLQFHRFWYQHAARHLRPGVGVIGTNDRCNRRTMRGEHATHMLVTRSYVDQHGTIDEPGKFYHEGYPHEWCDDEAVETARHRGAFVSARDSIVEHLHPMNGKAPMDAMYALQSQRIQAGRALYQRRRRLWT